MHMEYRQHVQQHLAWLEMPVGMQYPGVGGEVPVRQHGALGAARGPRGIQDRGEVVAFPRYRIEIVGIGRSAVDQRTAAIVAEFQHLAEARIGR